MEFDLPTLLAVEGFIAALSGFAILLGCPRGRDSSGCIWWVAGSLVTGLGIGLLLFGQTLAIVTMGAVGTILLTLAPAFYWTAARRFSGRPVLYALVPLGAPSSSP